MEPTEQRETLRDLPAAGGLHGLVAGLAAVNGREGAVVGGAVGEEGGALDLLDVVEAGNTDEALGEGAGAGADLLEDLLGVGAAVHGELPHDPVAVVVVAGVHGVVHVGPAVGVGVGLVGGLELNAGSPAVVEEVLDLAGDLLVGEGGEEGESLEEPGEGERGERGVEVSSVDRFFEKSFFSAFGREPPSPNAERFFRGGRRVPEETGKRARAGDESPAAHDVITLRFAKLFQGDRSERTRRSSPSAALLSSEEIEESYADRRLIANFD